MIIIKNAIRCNICGDEIESRHCHDYRICRCGACGVDGGDLYLKRVGYPEYFTDISVIDWDSENHADDKNEQSP